MKSPSLHVLLVEDNPHDAQVIGGLLADGGSNGVHLQLVEHLSEVAGMVAEHQVDAVVLDLSSLSETKGLEAVRQVQRMAGGSAIIVLGGDGDSEKSRHALQEGAQDYLAKVELTPELLRRTLASAVERNRAMARYIARRQRPEDALLDSEARLHIIEHATDEVFWMSDPELSQLHYLSPAYERIFGRPRQAIEQNPLSFVDYVHPDDRERVVADVSNLRQGKAYEHQFRLIHPDGRTRWISNRGIPVGEVNEKPTHYVGVSKDITQRVELEENLRQSQKMEAIGRLAGGLAHDFNNLLTVIGGFGELIQEKLAPQSELRAYCDEIGKASQNAASLTQQLLAFSRRQVLKPVVLDLNEVVKHLQKMLGRLIGENIELRVLFHPELWRVKADSTQMEQVLLNLAVNARDAMPDGGTLTLELKNTHLDEAYARAHKGVTPGDYVTIIVTDSGIGMDRETQAQIFEPFFTTKGQGKGTGLGLATVYGIVKQSGGFIWVYSEPGKGTSFKIYLPFAEGTAAPRRPQGVRRENLRGTETILLVEDDSAVRACAATVLETNGYKVLSAADPEAALRLFDNQKPTLHLLLTDVVMPKWTGRYLADQLTAKLPDLKVLFISGYTESAVVHQCILDEGTALLPKPFTPAQLLRMIRGVLEGQWPPRQKSATS